MLRSELAALTEILGGFSILSRTPLNPIPGSRDCRVYGSARAHSVKSQIHRVARSFPLHTFIMKGDIWLTRFSMVVRLLRLSESDGED